MRRPFLGIKIGMRAWAFAPLWPCSSWPCSFLDKLATFANIYIEGANSWPARRTMASPESLLSNGWHVTLPDGCPKHLTKNGSCDSGFCKGCPCDAAAFSVKHGRGTSLVGKHPTAPGARPVRDFARSQHHAGAGRLRRSDCNSVCRGGTTPLADHAFEVLPRTRAAGVESA